MGLFGKSLDELARKEMELRKKYVSRTPGEDVNVKIDDLRNDDIINKSNLEVARYNYSMVRIMKYSLYVLSSLIFVFVILFTVEHVLNPKPDYDEIYSDMESFLNAYEDEDIGITLKEYERIKDGMSYSQVSKILGGPGELLSSTDLGLGSKYVSKMYSWDGKKEYSSATIMFQGGKVTMRSQFLLE